MADYRESRSGKSGQKENGTEGGNKKQPGKGLALFYLLLAILALAACICVITCHEISPQRDIFSQFSAVPEIPDFPELPELPEMPEELREALEEYSKP